MIYKANILNVRFDAPWALALLIFRAVPTKERGLNCSKRGGSHDDQLRVHPSCEQDVSFVHDPGRGAAGGYLLLSIYLLPWHSNTGLADSSRYVNVFTLQIGQHS